MSDYEDGFVAGQNKELDSMNFWVKNNLGRFPLLELILLIGVVFVFGFVVGWLF